MNTIYPPEMIKELRRAMVVASRRGDLHEVAKIKLLLGNIAYESGNQEEARQFLTDATKLYKGLDVPAGIAKAYVSLGKLYRESYKDVATAEACFIEALEIYRKLKEPQGGAEVLSELSFVAQDKGELETAFKFAEQTYAIQLRLGNNDGVFYAKYRLGILALETKRYDLAESLFNECRQHNEQLADRTALSETLLQLSRLALRRSDVVRGVQLAKEYLPIVRATKGPDQAVISFFSLALEIYSITDVDIAIKLVEECLLEVERSAVDNEFRVTYQALARYYLWALHVDLGKTSEAKKHYTLANSYFIKTHNIIQGETHSVMMTSVLMLFEERVKIIRTHENTFELARTMLIMTMMMAAFFVDPKERRIYGQQFAERFGEYIAVFKSSGDKHREGIATKLIQGEFMTDYLS